MIMGVKPYPAYKDSGVEWLGNVPEYWEVRRLRTVVEMRVSNVDKHTRENELPVRLCNYVDVYNNDRITTAMSFMRATASYDESKRFRLKHDDVLITKDSEDWRDIGVPSLVKEPADDLISGYHLAILRSFKHLKGAYLAWALQSNVIAYQFHVAAKGVTRYGLSHNDIQSVVVPSPTIPEQTAIVRYLGHVDNRIQRYIHAKQKLLTLLEEQKQAIIHRAVTGQIDVRTGEPYLVYKSSGRDVPKHWEVRRLKTLSQIRYGLGQPPKESADGLPLIRATNVSRGRIIDKDMVHVDPADVPAGRNAFLSEREIIVVRSGVNTADSAIISSEYKGAVTGYDMVVNVSRALPEFIAFVLLDAYVHDDQLFVASMRSAQPHLNAEELGSALVLLPPSFEQTAIVEFLDRATADINTAITRTRRQIELLQEYRTRLVADVVTGKLDVRDVVASLPDESESLDTKDEYNDVETTSAAV